MTSLLPSRISRSPEPWAGRDVFRSMREEMDDLMSRFFGDGGWEASRRFAPSLDLSETDDRLEIRLDLPGIQPDEVHIEVTGNTVRISGERKEEREEKGRTYHRIERCAGAFARTVTLPCAVQESEVEAVERDGVLTITLPKTDTAKTHKVTVKAK